MIINPGRLSGVYEITPEPLTDSRGFFTRTYDSKLFSEHGINMDWVQENHSRSEQKGIIRGLHFQFPPFAESKLVRAIKGAVLDVFVDLRAGSETFGQWDSVELSEQNMNMVLVPRGFAHGFCTLTEISEVLYKVDNFYSPEHEGGIYYMDETLGIEWPVSNALLSDKDKGQPSLKEFIARHGGLLIKE